MTGLLPSYGQAKCRKLAPLAGLEPAILRLRPGTPSRGTKADMSAKMSTFLRSNGNKLVEPGEIASPSSACEADALLLSYGPKRSHAAGVEPAPPTTGVTVRQDLVRPTTWPLLSVTPQKQLQSPQA